MPNFGLFTTIGGIAGGISEATDIGATPGGVNLQLGPVAAAVSVLDAASGAASLIDVRGADAPDPSAGAGQGQTVIEGGPSDDSLTGSAGPDFIYGRGGRDTIAGGDGNDHLYGNGPSAGPDGADLLSGGRGGDYLQGNAGADTLDGGDGSDRINGGADDDVILGGAGNDTVNGNFGADLIDGGDGNDFLRGGKGDDMIFGGAGDDVVLGDLGSDSVTGGSGADIFRFDGNAATLVDTDLLLGRSDAVLDYAHGVDHLALGFAPTAIVHGAAQASAVTALAYAQALLDGLPGGGDVAAVQVGADTLLFYGAGGGLVADSVVRLVDVTAATIGTSDFI